MCVISPQYSPGMVSLMWRFSPSPEDMFAQSELELFQIDSLARQIVWHPKIAETQGNLAGARASRT